jgi:hypothetical protein
MKYVADWKLVVKMLRIRKIRVGSMLWLCRRGCGRSFVRLGAPDQLKDFFTMVGNDLNRTSSCVGLLVHHAYNIYSNMLVYSSKLPCTRADQWKAGSKVAARFDAIVFAAQNQIKVHPPIR